MLFNIFFYFAYYLDNKGNYYVFMYVQRYILLKFDNIKIEFLFELEMDFCLVFVVLFVFV